MDPHHLTRPAAADADDWDNDDFVIPSLSVGESDLGDWEISRASDPQPPPKPTKDRENIYLGPHGAPPSRAKKQEDTSPAIGYCDKNKVKEADQKVFGTGRDSKRGNARDFHCYNNAGHHLKGPLQTIHLTFSPTSLVLSDLSPISSLTK